MGQPKECGVRGWGLQGEVRTEVSAGSLFMGSESGAQLGLQFLPPPLGCFSSYSATVWREEWRPGTPFMCTDMTKGHKSKLSSSAGST